METMNLEDFLENSCCRETREIGQVVGVGDDRKEVITISLDAYWSSHPGREMDNFER